MTEARKEVVIQLTRLFGCDDTNLIFINPFFQRLTCMLSSSVREKNL